MDIAIVAHLEPEALLELLSQVLPGLTIELVDADQLADAGPADARDVLIVASRNASEFSTGLSFFVELEAPHQLTEWLREVARALSRQGHRTICDGTGLGGGSPYESLVWEEGAAFLADDAHSTYADGSGGPVRIVRALAMPPAWAPDRLANAVRRRVAGR